MTLLPQSIRWRMQLWHGLLLLLVLTGFGVTAWKLEERSEMARVDAELQPIAGVLLGMFHRQREGGPRGRPPPPAELFTPFGALDDQPPMPREIADWMDEVSPEIGFVRAWDRNAHLIMERGKLAPLIQRPDNSRQLPLSPQGATLVLPSHVPVRTLAVLAPPGESGVVGRRIDDELKRLGSLKWSMIGLGGGVWVLGLLFGGWLTGRGLRPIRSISEAALNIADGHLDQRINIAETESELGQLASVLNTSFERLQQSFEKQAQFTADAAHELRTPVSVVLSQAQLALSRERDAAEYRDALGACERAAKRMQSLTESLLQLSRLDAKAEPLRMEELDLSTIVHDTAEMLRPLAESRGLRLEVQTSSALCRGDAEKLGQVFTNLLSNALHHSAEGATITLKARSDGEWAEASVTDQGPGIAAEHLPFLFDRFYRADESRNRNSGGAGLGLAICKAIVDAHAGTIEARSDLGKGSEFIVRLPLKS